MNKAPFLVLLMVGTAITGLSSGSAAFADSKGLKLEVDADASSFQVTLRVNHENQVYQVGDLLTATVTSNRAGRLYVLHEDAAGRVSVVFPNKFQPTNWIQEGVPVSIPAAGAGFRLRVTRPTGSETLRAIVTSNSMAALEQHDLRTGSVTPLADFQTRTKGLLTEELQGQSTAWGSAAVDITVTDGRQSIFSQASPIHVVPQRPQQQPAAVAPGSSLRTLIVIGVRVFQDGGIRALRAADQDAQEFAAAMQQYGRIDHCIMLLNKDATKENIRRAFEEAKRVTAAGGEIFVYISSHGIRTAALDPSQEPDGFDEAIVVSDSRFPVVGRNRQTVILDHELADWLESFESRRVVAIFDLCHAGGFATKSVDSFAKGLVNDTERMLQRKSQAKDITRPDTAILASSQDDELSFERRTGFASVLTYELVRLIRDSGGPVTIDRAAERVCLQVEDYVRHTFATSQRPVFVNRLSRPVYLRLP